MKKKNVHGIRRLSAVALALVMLVSCILFTSPSITAASELSDAHSKSLEEQIANLQAQQATIQAKLNQLAGQQASLSEQKQVLDTLLDTLTRKMEAAETLMTSYEEEIRALSATIDQKQAEYDEKFDDFLTEMALTQEESEISFLSLLFGSVSLRDFLTRIETINSMREHKKRMMDELEETSRTLKADRAEVDEKILAQEATIATYTADQATYTTEVNKILTKMAALDKDTNAARQEFLKNQAEEEKLDRELAAYIAELQRKNNEKMEAGDWYWPIDLSVDQRNTSAYGWRLLYGVWDYHRGWDIACYLGNDIHAAKGGTVITAQYHNSYGNYVVIDHGDGVSTVYAHASKLLVSKGDKVTKGQVIAKVGTSGNSTGYHLHFEFRLNGQYTDPFKYIPNPPIKVYASRYSKS